MKLVQHGAITHGRGWMQTCGQCAIAMIADISLGDACRMVGHRHATTFSDLQQACEKLGIRYDPRKLGMPPEDGTHIVRVSNSAGRSHWIIRHNGLIFDSAIGVSFYPVSAIHSYFTVYPEFTE